MAYWYQSGHSWYWNPNPDAKPGNLHGYSVEAITDPNQPPPQYHPPKAPDPPPDVNIPTLTLADGWPPPLTGTIPKTFASDIAGLFPDNGPPPSHAAYHVLPSTIRDAEATIVASLRSAVDEAHTLKAYLDRTVDWVFYKPSPGGGTTNGLIGGHNPPSSQAMEMVSSVNTAALGGEDAITLVGRFLDRLNLAGQTYVDADKKCTFPAY